jgi:hypothetical protein
MPFLQFKGRTAVECHHHTIPHHTLEFDKKLSVLAKGEKPGLEGNLIVEGDNLLGLKALLPTHAGKIKCIYIDPPYNTGQEGWVYNDRLDRPFWSNGHRPVILRLRTSDLSVPSRLGGVNAILIKLVPSENVRSF